MVASAEESPQVKTRSMTRVLLPAWITRVKARAGRIRKVKSRTWQTWFQGISAFAVPISIAVLIVGVYQFKSQQKAAAGQALNQQRQAIIDTYLNNISNLVLTYHLSGKNPGPAVKALATARTGTAVRNLDGGRKGILIRYLWEAGLIIGRSPTVSLHKVNLNWAAFRNAYLYGANLSTDYLYRANLSGADAHGANLSWTDLIKADLYKANLSCIPTNQFAVTVETFKMAHPEIINCANLKRANLSDANLADADLVGTNLTHAILAGANLKGARYNAHQILITGANKNTLIIPATQWPQGFNPTAAGACAIDCHPVRPGG